VRKTLVFVAVVSVAAGVALTGCSSLPLIGGGGTGLHQALGRIAATDATRKWVTYDAIGKLTRLVGKQPGGSGFGLLLLDGTDLGPVAELLPGDTGIAALDADYGVSAGLPPDTVSVLAGGQHSDRIGKALASSGWTRDGDRYIGPDVTAVTDDSKMRLALNLAQVRTGGADVVFGKSRADLGAAGHPGSSLADDQPTAALADCLGDVVAAQLSADFHSPIESSRLTPAQRAALAKQRPAGIQLDKLREVAVGVRTPKSTSDTPRAVVCVAWADQSAADGYAAALPGVLSAGTSLASNQPYARLLHNPQTRKVGGGAHIVQWSADEGGGPGQVIGMLAMQDLPGLF
jgi:hypothetical protein